MNGYAIFGFGAFLGLCLGFIIAGLLGAAHRGDHSQDLWQAYQDGFDAGQGRPGCTLAGVANSSVWKPFTQGQVYKGQGG